jgi:hypothetical protein
MIRAIISGLMGLLTSATWHTPINAISFEDASGCHTGHSRWAVSGTSEGLGDDTLLADANGEVVFESGRTARSSPAERRIRAPQHVLARLKAQ